MRETPILGQRVVGIAIGLYVVLVLVASFHFNISLTPDRVLVLLLIAALGTGRIRSFLRDWSVFAVVILAWQVLQGMSNGFTHMKPHVTEMITFDQAIFFGQVPTIWMQQRLYHPGQIAWYDVAATALYLMHFVVPLGVAFALWFWRRSLFLEFMASFLLLALAGFATFVLFPAAPPWIAGNWLHKLPHVYRIYNSAITVFSGKQSFSAMYQWMWQHGGWDVYGAVPSEHAAFPFLCFLYLRKAWRRAGWIFLPYCVAVWVAVVYLGEHYAMDVAVAVVYASLAFIAVQVALTKRDTVSEHPVAEHASPDPVSERLPA